MVNNLVFRWPKPIFFMVFGAHGRGYFQQLSFVGGWGPRTWRSVVNWPMVSTVSHPLRIGLDWTPSIHGRLLHGL